MDVAATDCMLPEHGTDGADIAGVEFLTLLLGEGYEALRAAVLLLGRDNVGDAQSARAGPLAVGEHMKLGVGKRGQKVQRLIKELRCLAACAYDHVDADECVRHSGVDLGDAAGEKGGVVAAVHEAEHSVTAALERDVEVGHEPARAGAEADDVGGEQIGLNGGDAVTLYAVHVVESAEEREQVLVGTAPEVADIYACEHYLAPALSRHSARLVHEEGDPRAAA